MTKEITAQEARAQLLDVWTKCEFGLKERVSRVHSHRTIQYILKTPTYSKTEVILDIIETIKDKAVEIEEDAKAMNNLIKKALK